MGIEAKPIYWNDGTQKGLELVVDQRFRMIAQGGLLSWDFGISMYGDYLDKMPQTVEAFK